MAARAASALLAGTLLAAQDPAAVGNKPAIDARNPPHKRRLKLNPVVWLAVALVLLAGSRLAAAGSCGSDFCSENPCTVCERALKEAKGTSYLALPDIAWGCNSYYVRSVDCCVVARNPC